MEDLRKRVAELEALFMRVAASQPQHAAPSAQPMQPVPAPTPFSGAGPAASSSQLSACASMVPMQPLAVDPAPSRPMQPQAVPMDGTRVVMHEIVMPDQIDSMGICFGGQASPTNQSLSAPLLTLSSECRTRSPQLSLTPCSPTPLTKPLCSGPQVDRPLRWHVCQDSGQGRLRDCFGGLCALSEALPAGNRGDHCGNGQSDLHLLYG